MVFIELFYDRHFWAGILERLNRCSRRGQTLLSAFELFMTYISLVHNCVQLRSCDVISDDVRYFPRNSRHHFERAAQRGWRRRRRNSRERCLSTGRRHAAEATAQIQCIRGARSTQSDGLFASHEYFLQVKPNS